MNQKLSKEIIQIFESVLVRIEKHLAPDWSKLAFLISFSGGKDSYSLLLFYEYLMEVRKVKPPILFYLSHGIRSIPKEENEIFEFLSKTNYHFFFLKKDIPKIAKKIGRGLEETGRLYRYKEIRHIQKKHPSILLTGHHTKDYTESVLLHLTRGGGKRAFFTLPPFDGDRFLPLVYFEDKEWNYTVRYVLDHFKIWEDESNRDLVYKRNRLRSEIIPALEKENWNHYKTYWNFHDSNPTTVTLSKVPNQYQSKRDTYFRIPHETWKQLSKSACKDLIDFYLKELGFYPLYRSSFENFFLQAEGEKAFLENKLYILYKSKFGDLFIFSKKASCFLIPQAKWENKVFSVFWNHNQYSIPDPEQKYRLGHWTPGEKIAIRSGSKEISECMREYSIPFFLRKNIPILFHGDKPVQILFSLFSKSEKNYPKRVFAGES